MIPKVGSIVQYRLNGQDVEKITASRQAGNNPNSQGNNVGLGDVVPLIIVKVWGREEESPFNGQAFLDGNDSLWVTSTQFGDVMGCCFVEDDPDFDEVEIG